MIHIRSLAALKSRTAGTSGESKAFRYVRDKLARAGLDLRMEPFTFSYYELSGATLRAGGISVEPSRMIFDPYAGTGEVSGDLVFLPAATVNGPRGLRGVDVSRKIVVTTNQAQYFRIASLGPAAIVLVADADFEKLRNTGATHAELAARGVIKKLKSANLVATTRNGGAGRDVILSAHVDSAGTPGAQDNASGVAVLLELARLLPKLNLPVRLRFVFLGAEEVGLLGSKAYVLQHKDDLRRCQFLFNMDSVGGKDIWIDMRGGVRDISSMEEIGKLPGSFFERASNDVDGRWMNIGPELRFMDASNVPPWLQTAILDSAQELGYKINQGQNAGSDHRTFTAAGVVATNLAIGGIKSHTPDDVPAQIDPVSLERAARLITAVVLRSQAVAKP